MTPKNRDELSDHIDKWLDDDLSTGQLFKALDAAGLAIVPKEPTEAMLEAGEGCAAIAYAYDLMLEASPFKEGTTLQQKEPGE